MPSAPGKALRQGRLSDARCPTGRQAGSALSFCAERAAPELHLQAPVVAGRQTLRIIDLAWPRRLDDSCQLLDLMRQQSRRRLSTHHDACWMHREHALGEQRGGGRGLVRDREAPGRSGMALGLEVPMWRWLSAFCAASAPLRKWRGRSWVRRLQSAPRGMRTSVRCRHGIEWSRNLRGLALVMAVLVQRPGEFVRGCATYSGGAGAGGVRTRLRRVVRRCWSPWRSRGLARAASRRQCAAVSEAPGSLSPTTANDGRSRPRCCGPADAPRGYSCWIWPGNDAKTAGTRRMWTSATASIICPTRLLRRGRWPAQRTLPARPGGRGPLCGPSAGFVGLMVKASAA